MTPTGLRCPQPCPQYPKHPPQNQTEPQFSQSPAHFLSCVPAAQSCGPPPAVRNAQVQMRGDTDREGVSYVCDAGLQLVGPKTLSCLANGTWSAPAPTCERRTIFCSISLTVVRLPALRVSVATRSGGGRRLRRAQTRAARQGAGTQPEQRARCGGPVRQRLRPGGGAAAGVYRGKHLELHFPHLPT